MKKTNLIEMIRRTGHYFDIDDGECKTTRDLCRYLIDNDFVDYKINLEDCLDTIQWFCLKNASCIAFDFMERFRELRGSENYIENSEILLHNLNLISNLFEHAKEDVNINLIKEELSVILNKEKAKNKDKEEGESEEEVQEEQKKIS